MKPDPMLALFSNRTPLALVVGKPIGIDGVALVVRGARCVPFADGMDLRAMCALGRLCSLASP